MCACVSVSVWLCELVCLQKVIQEAAKDFISFVNKGPSPFHGECSGCVFHIVEYYLVIALRDYRIL